MVVYKLVRKLKDGSLSSLFINKKDRLPLKTWMEAELHPTKGYKCRQGWHCLLKPEAPHLSMQGRVWVKAEVVDYELFERPEAQGGTWILAQWMKIIEEVGSMALTKYNEGHQIPTCPKHGVELEPGRAIENTLTGEPDFIGDDEVITMHYGGSGKVIPCLKCPECGYSVYDGSYNRK